MVRKYRLGDCESAQTLFDSDSGSEENRDSGSRKQTGSQIPHPIIYHNGK